jgi:polyphosphate glucokinase
MSHGLGIQISKSTIKAVPVDVDRGTLTAEQVRTKSINSTKPAVVVNAVQQLITDLRWTGKVGIAFPGTVKDGVILTTVGLSDSWIGIDAREKFAETVSSEIQVIKDGDAAGIAEMRFGTGSNEPGTVVVLIFGTRISSALFLDGALVPNVEFGQIEVNRKIANKRASAGIGTEHKSDWEKWTAWVGEYIEQIEEVSAPQLVIIGGDVAKESEKWLPLLERARVRAATSTILKSPYARVAPAMLDEDAAIIGAAVVSR